MPPPVITVGASGTYATLALAQAAIDISGVLSIVRIVDDITEDFVLTSPLIQNIVAFGPFRVWTNPNLTAASRCLTIDGICNSSFDVAGITFASTNAAVIETTAASAGATFSIGNGGDTYLKIGASPSQPFAFSKVSAGQATYIANITPPITPSKRTISNGSTRMQKEP